MSCANLEHTFEHAPGQIDLDHAWQAQGYTPANRKHRDAEKEDEG
jgi:hypothetical protein